MEQQQSEEFKMMNNNTNKNNGSVVAKVADDDDIWGQDEEYRVDGQNDMNRNYDNYVASLNYNRMRETFVTLGIKEGVSEGLDEARQVYFEKGLVGGIREGVVCGFIIQLMSCMESSCSVEQQQVIADRKNRMKSESALWSREKMDRVMELCLGTKQSASNGQSSAKQQVIVSEERKDDEDLRVIGEAIEKFGKEVEMFRTTYGNVLRY